MGSKFEAIAQESEDFEVEANASQGSKFIPATQKLAILEVSGSGLVRRKIIRSRLEDQVMESINRNTLDSTNDD